MCELRDVLLLQLRRYGDILGEPSVHRASRQLPVLGTHRKNHEVAILTKPRVEPLDLFDRRFARRQDSELDFSFTGAGELRGGQYPVQASAAPKRV